MPRRHLLLTILTLFTLFSCEEDPPDYRERFTGNFRFTTERDFWEYGYPMAYDTTTFTLEGTVRFFEEGDDAADLYSDPDSLNPDSTLFIIFLPEGRGVLTEITEDGRFVSRGGYHYYCQGAFQGNDEVRFDVEGLGGLGAGWEFHVSGTRFP